MDQLRKRLLYISDFDTLSELCYLDENILCASKILENIDSNISPKNFLSSFVILNCSDEIIGKDNIKNNKYLINSARKLIYSDDNCEIKENLEIYCNYFNEWKRKDFKLIINSLSNEYFQTNLSLLNTSKNNTDKKILLMCYKKKILNYASKLSTNEDIVEQIMNYSPLIISHEKILSKYNDDFWKNIENDFDSDNFESFYNVINFLKDFYSKLNNDYYEESSNLFNVNYFKDILENNRFTNDDIKFFANKSYDLINNIQSQERSKLIQKYRFEVNSNSTYLPEILQNITNLTIKLVEDIELMQKN